MAGALLLLAPYGSDARTFRSLKLRNACAQNPLQIGDALRVMCVVSLKPAQYGAQRIEKMMIRMNTQGPYLLLEAFTLFWVASISLMRLRTIRFKSLRSAVPRASEHSSLRSISCKISSIGRRG